jgi:hypothetical protein
VSVVVLPELPVLELADGAPLPCPPPFPSQPPSVLVVSEPEDDVVSLDSVDSSADAVDEPDESVVPAHAESVTRPKPKINAQYFIVA